MGRYVGCDKNRIVWISDKEAEGAVPVPPEFDYATDLHIIKHFRFQNGTLVDRSALKDPSILKIALVGVWKIPCGISTYTEYLMGEIQKLCPNFRIFAEYDKDASEEINVERCWERGKPMGDLANRIKAYDPDVVLIQHEYGIFPDARHWLSLMTSLWDYKVFVALHSVYPHHLDKVACEAAIPNIIVHTELAKQTLIAKGITRHAHVIPHGCLLNEQKPRLWNIYKSQHTFMQFGFGFEYKGWENSLEACAILKKEFPDIFFTGLFSESPFSMNMHEKYHERLQALIQKLGIEENVSILRGFQSEEVLDSFFRLNRCAVFPYRDNGEHQVVAVTGAARMAMRHGIPTITSSVPFFSDLGGVCPKANTPEELAAEIKKAWKDPKPIIAAQDKFLTDNSWAEVARMYVNVLSGK